MVPKGEAVGRALFQDLHQEIGIDSALDPQDQPLGQGRDGHGEDQLVDELDGLAAPQVSHVGNVGAHHRQERPGGIDIFGRPAHEDGQGPLGGGFHAPGHRGVDHPDAGFRQSRAHLPGGGRVDGAHVDQQGPLGRSRQNAVFAQDGGGHVGGVGEHGDHGPGRLGNGSG